MKSEKLLKVGSEEPASPAFPGCNWTPTGASVVSKGQIAASYDLNGLPTGRAAPVSGRVTAIAIDPNDPNNTIYLGTAQGGVWKTTDGGQIWLPKTDFQFTLAIGAITIDHSIADPVTGRSNRVYIGTGEANFALDSYYGGGILRTDDGGETWTQLATAVF
jgi:hypothetical protein